MDAAEALKLVALSYRGCEYNLSNPHSRWIVCNELKSCLGRYAPSWNLMWGPAGYRPGPVGLDVSAMYAASCDASNLAIVIRGTNLFSVVDWLSNLPLDPKQWEYGGAPSGVNISLSTWLGLRLLQRLQCGPIPSNDPGESLAEKLEATAAKVEGAAGYALIEQIVQGKKIPGAPEITDIATHIGAMANSSFTVEHVASLQHAMADAQHPAPSSGTLLEYLRTFIATAAKPANIYVIGHSKSGALAPAFAQWLSDIGLHWDSGQKAKLHVFTFAGPTPGNKAFADRYKIDETRVFNINDVVPHVWQPDEMREISQLYDGKLAGLKDPLNTWATALESYRYQHEVSPPSSFAGENPPGGNFLQCIAEGHLNAYLKKFNIWIDGEFDILSLFKPI
jgi:hypothetical protein